MKKGDKIKLTEHNSDSQMNFGRHNDTRKYLKFGKIYEVEKVIVHSWHTEIFLKGYPGVEFNSVCFEIIKATNIKGGRDEENKMLG